MTFEELIKMDRTLPPIILTTESGSREEFMRRCAESKANVFKSLQTLFTADSLKHCGSFNNMCKTIAIRLQNNLVRMFQIPRNLLTRQDWKMVIAWGVHNIYVKGYATKHHRLMTRDWTDDMERGLTESVRDVVKEMFTMANDNSMTM